MKNNPFLFLTVITLGLLITFGCSNIPPSHTSLPYNYDEDYATIIKPYLDRADFSNPRFLSYMMDIIPIPQEYAFKYQHDLYMSDFYLFYKELTNYFDTIKSLDLYNYGLSRLSLIKVLAQYLKLAGQSKDHFIDSEIETKIYEFLISEIELFYTVSNPGWPPLHSGTVKDRVEWGLSAWTSGSYESGKTKVAYSINDDLWRLFDATGQIKQYINNKDLNTPAFIDDLLSLAYSCVEEGGTFNNQGYFFQLGILSDSGDHTYAGHTSITENMLPSIIENIGWDTSHFSMFPSMIASLQYAFPEGSLEFNFYNQVNNGIAEVFYNNIVEYIDGGVYTKNYMNGSNGLYRYDSYIKDAYLPYELSGTILFATWAFLNSEGDYDFFNHLYHSFPLSSNILDTYQSKFSRHTGNYASDQVEFYYEKPEMKVYSYFALKIIEARILD